MLALIVMTPSTQTFLIYASQRKLIYHEPKILCQQPAEGIILVSLTCTVQISFNPDAGLSYAVFIRSSQMASCPMSHFYLSKVKAAVVILLIVVGKL